MTSKVQLRRSAVPGKVPTTAQIDLGELAINTRDGKLFLKRDNGDGSFSIIDLGAVNSVAGRTGDVTLTAGDVGLGNVNNTSDADKPISTAQAEALAGKVGTARQVATGVGLTGGGELSTDRTIAADIATKDEAEVGAADNKLMSALSVEQHMMANALGWGQSWTPLLLGGNVIHQNLTGRPIVVAISNYNLTYLYAGPIVSGAWTRLGECRYNNTLSVIIPDGWRYYWNVSVGLALTLS